jgi:predicted metal-dependent phosphoesterase TrpH
MADGGSVGRAHLARVLVARGHAEDLSDAFERLIGKGRPFWEPADVPTAAQALDTIRGAGGLPVLAHPALSGVRSLIVGLAAEGLAGIEAYHAEHTPGQASELAAQARALGLLVTGGSDYHGPDGRTARMGAVELPEGAWEALMAARP